jgi:hypothetical protein
VRHRANPTLIIALALLMSAPSIEAAISGALAIDTLCVRLAMAVVVAYVGVRVITRVIHGYAAAPRAVRREPVDRTGDIDLGG